MIAFVQNNINTFVGTLVLISNISFVLFFVIFLIEEKVRSYTYLFVRRYILHILFLFSLAATVGSLIYSDIAGFPPCELCWIQRIFMYPQPILAYMGMLRKDRNIVDYLLPLSIIGTVVSFYHSLVHWGIGGGLLACTTARGDCAKVYTLEYGYITIPFMAFTTFVFLLAFSALYYISRNDR